MAPSARTARNTVDNAARSGRHVAQREQQWLIPLGRAGFAANGVVYLLVGVLAAQAALGVGGDTTDTGGVLGHIVEAPFGRVLLGITAVGLVGYALWRFLQAVLDTEHKGSEPKGLAARIGFGVAAASYAALSMSAIGMALGTRGQPDQEQATQDRTAWLMSHPLGPWLVVAAGAIVVGVGVAQFVIAYRASFADKLVAVRETQQRLVGVSGRIGYTARGFVFLVIGLFLVLAGIQTSPDQARGLGGVLAVLAAEPLGPWLLGVVALGLAAYGVFMLLAARYRRMVLS
ncbi:MAG: DUF1206 domain-containing protein [Chloroflexi bacterium]|nr:DUF1206 domain-containing protein [Chloroflexota bacterium]